MDPLAPRAGACSPAGYCAQQLLEDFGPPAVIAVLGSLGCYAPGQVFAVYKEQTSSAAESESADSGSSPPEELPGAATWQCACMPRVQVLSVSHAASECWSCREQAARKGCSSSLARQAPSARARM